MIRKQTGFIFAIALQVIIILAIVFFKLTILSAGTEVLLKIEPIDPRSPLRGDYLSFQYNISRLEGYLVRDEARNGDTIYVILRMSGKYWTAEKAQKTKPTGGVFLKGKVVSGGLSGRGEFFSVQPSVSLIRVVYGVEEYYIPEGKGTSLNLWERGSEAFAKVVVDENGNAVLKQIYVDDKPWP